MDEIPSLPLAYFEEGIPTRQDWPDAPCGYLLFSEVYRDVAQQARFRGWPVKELQGHHFLMLTNPKAVADALVDLSKEARML